MKTETLVILGIVGWFVYDSWQKTQGTTPATLPPSGPADPLGQPCLTADGHGGTFQRAWDGSLVCVPDVF